MEIQPFDVVIYHSNCYDGFGSAWVARQHSPGAVFIGAQHGDPPPLDAVVGKRVLICDFSYPIGDIHKLRRRSSFLMVLDHHKTAKADLACFVDIDDDTLHVTFDMERSGIGLTWDTLLPRVPRPRLVDHVEDRDLWRFSIPGTREVHASLSMIPFDFDAWDVFADRPMNEVEAEGAAVRKYMQNTAAKLADRARKVMLVKADATGGGLVCWVWAVNVPVEFVSETAEVLKGREPHMPVLAWSWDGKRCNFYCSLRSRDDGPDVSEIAKRFGGGGHEHAAGFRCSRLDAASDVFAEVVKASA